MNKLSSLVSNKKTRSLKILKFYSNIHDDETVKYANQLLREHELAFSLSVDFSHPRRRAELTIDESQSVGEAIKALGRKGIYLKSKPRSKRNTKKQSFWARLFSIKRKR